MIEMKLKKNYKYQFKINQILKDKSDLKKNSIERRKTGRWIFLNKKNYLALVLNSTHQVYFETFRSHSLPNRDLNLTCM